jgi:hypothetical protein
MRTYTQSSFFFNYKPMNSKANKIKSSIYTPTFLCIISRTKTIWFINDNMYLSNPGLCILNSKVQTITSKIDLPHKVKTSKENSHEHIFVSLFISIYINVCI